MADPALWVDVAAAAGLLAQTAKGYAAAGFYDAWRDDDPARRWAAAALAWFGLDAAPTSRKTDDGEVPPPVPMESAAGMVRRALLRAAAGGRSLRAAVAQIGWFCPLHPYDADGLAAKTAAAVQEAVLLGVVGGDRLTALGSISSLTPMPRTRRTPWPRRATRYCPGSGGCWCCSPTSPPSCPGRSGPQRLRAAGFAPMPEDALGAVIVPDRSAAEQDEPGEHGERRGPRSRGRVDAAVLAARLRSPGGKPAPASASYAELASLAPHLDEAEVALLADALDHETT